MAASWRKNPTTAENAQMDVGFEDELSVPTRLPRVTPRNSIVGEAIAAASKETPYANLRQLAGIIRKPSTPLRRASSTGPPSTRGWTPATQSRTPGTGRPLRPAPSKRGPPTTPHAIRALQQRRAAALTPGRDRRRSGRMQRETPRDALRNLSKILARTTRPTEPSPHPAQASTNLSVASEDDELDRQPDMPTPRLSMPIDKGDEDDQDDDSFHVPPPRLSVPLDDDTYTQKSIEVPRRAISEQPYGRSSRGSFGSIRMSDRFADIHELGLDAVSEVGAEDSMLRPEFDEEYHELLEHGEANDPGGETQDLRRAILEDSSWRQSRPSDILPRRMLEDEDETTFAFHIPHVVPRESLSPEPGMDTDPLTTTDQLEPSVSKPATTQDSGRKTSASRNRLPKVQKLSRHGIAYPSLPAGVVKKLASTFARTSGTSKAKINKETLGAIIQASDWFFEQLGDDLGTYTKHAGRQTIDETDVITLMKRQRMLNASTTPFSLAQKYLPRELLQDIHMAPPAKPRPAKQTRMETVQEEEEEDEGG